MRSIGAILLFVLCCSPLRAKTPDPLSCRNNVVALDEAKQQLQINKKLRAGDPVEPSTLTPYFHGGLPTCPAGGSYTVGPIGQEPFCSIAAHSREAVQEFISRQPKASLLWLVFTKRFVLLGALVFVTYLVFRRVTRSL